MTSNDEQQDYNGLASAKMNDISSSSSALESLQTCVYALSSKNSDQCTCCQLVSADTDLKSLYNSTITEINTIVFRPVVDATAENDADRDTVYAVAIVPSSDKIDLRRFSHELATLQTKDKQGKPHRYYDQWELAPSEIVRDLCGFEPGTIPPLLVPPLTNEGTDSDVDDDIFQGMLRPFATIVDSSLLWRNHNSNSSSISSSPEYKRLLLGGGGSMEYRSLIDLNFFVQQVLQIDTDTKDSLCQSETRRAKIANILRFDGGMSVNRGTSTIGMSSSLLDDRYTTINNNNDDTPVREASAQKPFFQIAPPRNAIGDMDGSAPSTPHRPIPVTAIGRLISVRQIAKKLVFADFAPPDYDYQRWLTNKHATDPSSSKPNYDKTETGMPGPPWRSGEDGKHMYVQIIVGKTFCERYQDGTSRLKSLKPGKLVLVRGAANVDPMQKNGWRNSAGNWAQKRSLDVIVSSFELLDDDDTDDSLRRLVEEAQREVASRGTSSSSNSNSSGNWNSLLPWERKKSYERRAVAGTTTANGDENNPSGPPYSSNNSMNGSTNVLTLDVFNSHLRDDPLEIKIVDDDASIRAMASDISKLFSLIQQDDQSNNLLEYVAGIDCEWRPTGAYAEALLEGPDDNPVALLQICLPAIGKVYLVDTHQTLRANLADTEAMTDTEAILSEAIGTMFASEAMIKAGYNVAIDFRRLAASFPHIASFRNVRSVVELSALAERLHPKSAKPFLGSLQKLTKLVLGYNITKDDQCSNWEGRPLTPSQIEYATLDCALPPRLLDQMTEGSGTARMRSVLPGATKSWRFQTIDGSRKDAIRRLKAKRVVGNTFVVSQSWLNRAPEPDPTSIPEEGGGPYTDTDGLLKMPADLISIGGNDAPWKSMSGQLVSGGKKSHCIDLLVGDDMPKDAILDYNPRSGFIAFEDGLALFVNMPDPTRKARRRMPYPNEWLEDGRFLTWYIRKNDWDNGNSEVAKLLLGSKETDDDSAPSLSSVVLFVRVGSRDFVCCGSCTASVADDDSSSAKSNKKLVKLNLRLNDWETMKHTAAFAQLLEALKPRKEQPSHQNDPVSFQMTLAQTVVDGNIVGAFGMALDALSVSPEQRSIAYGQNSVKILLSNSNDPLVLQAKEIVDNMML